MQKNKFREDRQAYFNLQSECKNLKTRISALDAQCSVEMIKRSMIFYGLQLYSLKILNLMIKI